MTGSPWQLYNGICLMATFFASRLVWGSYQTVSLASDALHAWRSESAAVDQCLATTNLTRTPESKAPLCSHDFPTRLLIVYLASNAVLTCLNVYWFFLMVKALEKRFKPNAEPSSNSPPSTDDSKTTTTTTTTTTNTIPPSTIENQ